MAPVTMRPGWTSKKSLGIGASGSQLAKRSKTWSTSSGRSSEGDLARPAHRRPSAFARLKERPTVLGQFLVRQYVLRCGLQRDFEESVVLQRELLAGRRSKRKEAVQEVGHRKIGLGPRQRDRRYVPDALDALGEPAGPVKGERRSPVLPHHGDAVADVELFEQLIEVAPLLEVAVANSTAR